MQQSLISQASFSAYCKRTSDAPNAADGAARFAIMQGATGQTTPANALIGAMRDGGIIGGAVGKATLAMLGEGLREFCTFDASGAVKARKGSEWLGKDAATVAALALRGIPERMAEAAEARAEAKAKAAKEKAAKLLITAAKGPAPVLSPLAQALLNLGTVAEAEAAKLGERIGETREAGALAAYATARAMLAQPGIVAMLRAALPMMGEAEADAKAEADAAQVKADAAKAAIQAEADAAKAEAKAKADAMSTAPALGAAFEAAHAKAHASAALA